MPAQVSRVQADDVEPLASFLANFANDKRSSAEWLARLRAWWDLNPAFADSPARGWILKDNGKIVGFLGTIPTKLRLCGKVTTSFGGTTWRVLPEYRGMSMLLKRMQMDDQKDYLHVTTTPRPEVEKLLKLLKYNAIDRGEGKDEQSVIIFNFKQVLRARFPGFVGAIVGPLLSPVLTAVQDSKLARHRPQGSNKFVVKEIARADAAFDDLWRRTETRFLNTSVRTADLVNWYCFSVAEVKKRLLACYEGNKLLGYMILLTEEDPKMRVLECIDLWIDPAAGEEQIAAALISKARACARTENFDRLLFPHFDTRTSILYKKLGLPRRPAWKKREYISGPPELTAQLTPEKTYFVMAQGDYGL